MTGAYYLCTVLLFSRSLGHTQLRTYYCRPIDVDKCWGTLDVDVDKYSHAIFKLRNHLMFAKNKNVNWAQVKIIMLF